MIFLLLSILWVTALLMMVGCWVLAFINIKKDRPEAALRWFGWAWVFNGALLVLAFPIMGAAR